MNFGKMVKIKHLMHSFSNATKEDVKKNATILIWQKKFAITTMLNMDISIIAFVWNMVNLIPYNVTAHRKPDLSAIRWSALFDHFDAIATFTPNPIKIHPQSFSATDLSVRFC